MTIMTPIEGITAPAYPGATPAALPTETFLPYDETPLLSSRRADGWSAANQRLFLEAIAEGYGVEQASMRVGLSAASAYAFRRTAKGAAFALGWRAANLVARDAIAETLLVRALEGQVSTITRANGDVVTRHHHDNGLCMRLLARLDRQVETAADADVKAARLVAQEFDAYLDLVAKDESPARAGLFLARRCGGLGTEGRDDDTHDLAPIYALAAADRFARTGVATAQDVDVHDLYPAARANWTAEQWQRAEAAGVVALAPTPDPEKSAFGGQDCQHSAARAEGSLPAWLCHDAALPTPVYEPVWFDEDAEDWRTYFPPAAGHLPDHEEHEPGHPDYARSLSEAEAALMDDPLHCDAAELAALAAECEAYFAARAAAMPGPVDDAPADDPVAAPAAISLTQRKPEQNSGTSAGAARSPDNAAPAAGEPT